jgi:hypothetical protein
MLKAFTMGSTALAIGLAMGGVAYAQTSTAPTAKSGAMKLTQAECQSIWNRLDTAKAGNVSEAQAKQYVTDFKSVDANNDGKLSQAEFQSGCDKGQVHSSATTGPASGTNGSKK